MGYDVVIVGAGASGLVAAIAAARKGSSVLVIEQKDKAGKKILATGNGKCNFTNLVQRPECYRSDDSAFAMKVLSCFDVVKTIKFFEELGIYPKDRNGYLYPNSEQASSVVQVLMMECERLGVNFIFGEHVKYIVAPYYTVIVEKTIDSEGKQTSSDNKQNTQDKFITYYGKSLILAAGGCASSKLGSDGSGYLLAKSFGHTIIKPLPALVQLKSSAKYCKTLSGVRTVIRVEAYNEETLLAGEEGEIIFTDYGISGIPIMQISRFVAKVLDQGKKVSLMLDFLPEISMYDVEAMINVRVKQNSNKNIEEMLVGLFNQKLSYILIKEAKLDLYQTSSTLTKQQITELTKQIKEFKMLINDTNSFDNAQVCAGGVSTKEIEETSMESKLKKHLYLTGELVDVDGTCGGYNLQWAWSTGYLAGTAAGSNDKLGVEIL